jgi:hypothetical protein
MNDVPKEARSRFGLSLCTMVVCRQPSVRVGHNSTAAPEVLVRAAVAAVQPAVLPGAPALQTLDWELTPAKMPS